MAKLDKMEDRYNELFARFIEQTQINEELKTDIRQIQVQLNKLEKADPITNSTNRMEAQGSVEAILGEIYDRESRKKNFIIFGLPDINSDTNMVEAKDLAIKVIKNSCPTSTDDVNSVKVLGLGKYVANKCRPVKVICTSEEMALSVIRNTKDLKMMNEFNKIFISTDKTQKQIQEYKSIKQQLKVRTANDDSNLRIKYFNSVPKIVSTHSASSTNNLN